ncbi:TraB/GumN family protein [Catenovulum sp. SM1970]|uniref:TraB/GumN family protein n=1 Tax=Marinifaba aquimaris TaxID=2741323 RepID=UPI0015740BD2|nr:TraB/GumN family protein [Marinifaba aquimaris]NTS76880.1 TraB/GumN family protein [Marinifaba aquimaris]
MTHFIKMCWLALIWVSLFSAYVAHAKEPTYTPAVWQLEYKDNTSWLLGTIHASDTPLILPDAIDKQFKQSRKLIVEIDITQVSPAEMQQAFMPHMVSKKPLAINMQKQIKTALPNFLYDKNTQPWLINMQMLQFYLASQGYDYQQGADLTLITKAHQMGKQVISLERFAEQLTPFFSQKDQGLANLKDTLASFDEEELNMAYLLSAWQRGDLAAIEKVAQHTNQLSKESQLLQQQLLKSRNIAWVDKLIPILAHPGNFIAVGLMHMTGKPDENLLNLLSEQGIKIQRYQYGK